MTAMHSDGHAHIAARNVSTLTWLLSLVHPGELGNHLDDILGDQLDDIHADMAMARQMRPETTERWFRELEAEERHVRAELRHTAGLP